MNELCSAACTFLADVYDGERGLFPYTTRVVGGRYVSEFDHPAAARYTVNCLLALRQADQLERGHHPFPAHWLELTHEFLARNPTGLDNDGDCGLFLVLAADQLTASGPLGDASLEAFGRLRGLVENGAVASLPLQEVCWVLWGLTALARAGVEAADPMVERLTKLLTTEFLDPRSGIPRHSLARARRTTVSFGGIVYFLRALHEVVSWRPDDRLENIFRRTLDRVLSIQREDGAWPWFVDVPSGRVIDTYAIYGVHQDSMSMLFLLPALDRGIDVRGAIDRSYGWVLGANQLGTSMIQTDPFVRYRSIERQGGGQRARRYGRALAARTIEARWLDRTTHRVRLNTECRSYELGWIVYVWSGRAERLGLTRDGQAVGFPEDP